MTNKREILASDFKEMIASGQYNLEQNADFVDSLNVFPVPDGDTGTNMNLSFTSGADYVNKASGDHVGELAKSLSKGLLMGARGNSGVILSQLFRGFAKAVESYESLDTKALAEAFQGGVKSAYSAIMKPVEGTVLTVARLSADAVSEKAQETDDVLELIQVLVDSAQKALDQTPDQLQVLKEVGVVDSGGQGLVFIYRGFLAALKGEVPKQVKLDNVSLDDLAKIEHQQSGIHDIVNTEDIKYGYCTEIMVRLGEGETVDSTFDYDEFREYLNGLGDSLLVVADDEIVKVHVHTETPGLVMNYGQKFGSLVEIKVDNMREQHSALVEQEGHQIGATITQAKKELAVIAVAAGSGVEELFTDLGVDKVILGGQTMNPSTEDIMKAIEDCPADNYIILPNNKNIFMSANQAADISEADIRVVESRTIQQGIGAMFGYLSSESLDDNFQAMSQSMQELVSISITTAIRDTEIEGLKIHKDDFIAIVDGDIKLSVSTMDQAVFEAIDSLTQDDFEIITLIYGDEIEEETAQSLADQLEAKYEDIEVEVHFGGQPVYPYLISVE